MPYGMCPVCGSTFHLSVGDVQKWYEQLYPSVPVGELVPAPCFFCWPELQEGNRVVIRDPIEGRTKVKPGDRGVVTKIVSSKDGQLYLVQVPSGEEYFIRAQLRKVRETEC